MSQYVLFLKSVITSWKTAAVKQAPRSVCIFSGTENTFIHKSTSCKLFRNTQSPWLFLSIDYRGMHVKDAILFSKRLKQINVRIFYLGPNFSVLVCSDFDLLSRMAICLAKQGLVQFPCTNLPKTVSLPPVN